MHPPARPGWHRADRPGRPRDRSAHGGDRCACRRIRRTAYRRVVAGSAGPVPATGGHVRPGVKICGDRGVSNSRVAHPDWSGWVEPPSGTPAAKRREHARYRGRRGRSGSRRTVLNQVFHRAVGGRCAGDRADTGRNRIPQVLVDVLCVTSGSGRGRLFPRPQVVEKRSLSSRASPRSSQSCQFLPPWRRRSISYSPSGSSHSQLSRRKRRYERQKSLRLPTLFCSQLWWYHSVCFRRHPPDDHPGILFLDPIGR